MMPVSHFAYICFDAYLRCANHVAATEEGFVYDAAGSAAVAVPVTAGLLVGLKTTAVTPTSCTGSFDPTTYMPGTWVGPQTYPTCDEVLGR